MPVAPPAGSRPATPTTPRPITAPPAAKVKKKSPVMAIAAAAVIVVGGGAAAAAVFMNGGPAGANGIDSTAIADSQVTGDTARRPAGGRNSGRTGTGTPRTATDSTRPESTTTTNPPPVATVDSAAIHQELGTLLDQSLEAATRAAARTRALEILRLPGVPRNQRAEAAAIAANVNADEGDMVRACSLMNEAQSLTPKASYQASLTSWGCRQ
jgi:hypothetical protein